MPDSASSLDETDRALVNALQVAPRASWTEVGAALGLHPATAARRWSRLRDSGLARVVAYPNLAAWARYRCLAFVEVDCAPAARDHVIARLVRAPRVASVTVASSGRDLYLTVLAPDLAAMSATVLGVTRVRGTRTHLVTHLFTEGGAWHLDSLTSGQRAALHPPSRVAAVLPETDRDLLLALSDGRRSVAEIAERTGTSTSTARRRLNRTLRAGSLSLRCETAQRPTGWPVSASFWARVPPHELRTVAAGLVGLPEIRMCAAVTGVDNLVISLWLRSLADSQRFEEQLSTRFPSLTVTDRTIELSAAKRMGCVLTPAGHTREVVPVDPWPAGS
ncbi:Lrp/AsnC family transcriptional regulator [Actinophytocola xanthii]|uniref:AsnC family transcriptional regulator n=1 Tax=Actinophytocola xanthii TaxID=1912961 RepID=A0A1Q8C4H6_9PSEU|nr:Lrp/AsnC family transcriptional regulator [Actinophytocola xanthii]OLF09268.1 AsnC family transcriptional regulator [Actinophytocola xanthii]